MSEALKNSSITQYFGDTTYRAIPPTFKRFKLYIISGFNIIEKHIRLQAYILIKNETEETYFNMFNLLKQNHGFNPKIYTTDFNRSSTKALKKVFPKVYIIKCFFHFVNALWKKIKKLKIDNNKNTPEISELLLSLKRLSFVNPINIPKIYKKLRKRIIMSYMNHF